MTKQQVIDYCGGRIQEANIALREIRDVQRETMNAGRDCSALTAQCIGLRERIAAYADVADRARQGAWLP